MVPTGCRTSTWIVLHRPPSAPVSVSYLVLTSSSIVSLVLSMAPLVVESVVITCGPKSSHMVPKRLTPAALWATGSSILASPWITSLKAAFASWPPAANLFAILSAFMPMASNPCFVVSDPSIARMENSFTASPILSRLNAPFSAPFAKIENMSSASKPSFWNCTEYSSMLSNNSPEKSRPF